MTSTAMMEPQAKEEGAPATPAASVRSGVPAVVRRRLAPFDARLDPYSWLAALLVTMIAAILRLVGLTYPRGKIFDELYYATEAQALLQKGVEWDLENNHAKYVVHPPLGKWAIALGEWIFGYNELGWRISAAVAGIATVLMITRIARRLFGSTTLGCAAGLLMAVDGMHLVLSRSALLDIFLLVFLLAAFGFLVIDRDARRRRWLAHVQSQVAGSESSGRPRFDWRHGVPWWRLAAAVMLGCALGVKWSAIFYILAFALLVVVWEVGARRSAGVRRPIRDTLLDETGWLILSGVLIVVIYLSTWFGWFVTDHGYGRHRLAAEGGTEQPVIGALQNLWRYHTDALGFHTTLDAKHPFQSWPWQWLLLGRPVSFYWSSDGPCGASQCAAEVLLLGTPVLWWSFILTIPLALWFGIARRDWRITPIMVGIAAGTLPWFYYALDKRTMFYFYALPAEPFMILATVYVLGVLITAPPGVPVTAAHADRRTIGAIVAGGYVTAVALCFAYFYPIYTGQVLTYAEWGARMWLGSRWI